MKSNKGITLIVLVITIIVIIILAGIAIVNLTGNNSMIDRAQEAKTSSDESIANETSTLGDYEKEIKTSTGGKGPQSSTIPVILGVKYYFEMDGHEAYFTFTEEKVEAYVEGSKFLEANMSDMVYTKATISEYGGGKYASTTAASTLGNQELYFIEGASVIVTESGDIYMIGEHTGVNNELIDMTVEKCIIK